MAKSRKCTCLLPGFKVGGEHVSTCPKYSPPETKHVIEGKVSLTYEDGGCAMIAEVEPADESPFARIQSWKDAHDQHPNWVALLAGKRVRVTVEELP